MVGGRSQQALVSQLAEETDSKPVQCEFESHRGHSCAAGQRHFYSVGTARRGGIVRSSFRGHIKSVRNFVQVVGEQMPVAVQRERRRLVPEKCLQNLHIGPGSDGQTRAGVTQFMRCEPANAGRFGGRVEHPPDFTYGQVAAATGREQQPLARAGTTPARKSTY
jgi:hypothetical protein